MQNASNIEFNLKIFRLSFICSQLSENGAEGDIHKLLVLSNKQSKVSKFWVYLFGQQIQTGCRVKHHRAKLCCLTVGTVEAHLCKSPQPHQRIRSAVRLQIYFYQCFQCAACLHLPRMSTHAGCRQSHHSWRHCRHSFGWRDFKGSVCTQRIINPAQTNIPTFVALFPLAFVWVSHAKLKWYGLFGFFYAASEFACNSSSALS